LGTTERSGVRAEKLFSGHGEKKKGKSREEKKTSLFSVTPSQERKMTRKKHNNRSKRESQPT